jgi:hypothetical protein
MPAPADRIAKLRGRLGLGQAEFARQAGGTGFSLFDFELCQRRQIQMQTG